MSQSSIHVYILIRVWWCKSVLINCVGRCLMPIESNVAPSPAEFFFSGASAALSGGHTSHRSRPSFGIASWQLSEKKAPGWGFFGGILHNLVMWIPISLKKWHKDPVIKPPGWLMEFPQISTRNYGCGTEVWILFGHGLAVKKNADRADTGDTGDTVDGRNPWWCRILSINSTSWLHPRFFPELWWMCSRSVMMHV